MIAKSCALPALNEALGFMTRSMARPRDVEGESRQKWAIGEKEKQQRSEASRGGKLRESWEQKRWKAWQEGHGMGAWRQRD